MLFRHAQLLTADIVLGLNRAVLTYQKAVGVFADTLEVGYHEKGRRQAKLFFELERSTEDGFGYTSLDGELTLSRAKGDDEWRMSTVSGAFEEFGADGLRVGTKFAFEGSFQLGKGLVMRLFQERDKVNSLAEFVV